MADVNVRSDGGGTNVVLAVVIIALLAVLVYFFFMRGGADGGADLKVDVNTPGQTAPGGGGTPSP